jgi:hypothetical protein
MHFTESFISVPILALHSTREITSNLSSAKIATKRFASHTESEINRYKKTLAEYNWLREYRTQTGNMNPYHL